MASTTPRPSGYSIADNIQAPSSTSSLSNLAIPYMEESSLRSSISSTCTDDTPSITPSSSIHSMASMQQIKTARGGLDGTSTKVLSAAKPSGVASNRKQAKPGGRERVMVCVRAKPPYPTSSIYDCSTETNTISLAEHHPTNMKRGGVIKGRENEGEFHIDHLHLPPTPTSALFNKVISPIVASTVDGFDGTVFAYGMTGSGKTYTMGGVEGDPGVIPRAIDQIFDAIDECKERVFLLRVSYLELYNETLRDLLNPNSKVIPVIHERDGRVIVDNLEEVPVRSPEEVQACLKKGEGNRRNGKTDFNEHSSRSHTVFSVVIESRLLSESGNASTMSQSMSSSSLNSMASNSQSRPKTSPSMGLVRMSRLNLIDLAGSERATTDDTRRQEGGYINKSLLTLANVIEKLTEPKPGFIAYRESKLTRLLQNSLSGHAKIAVVCTISLDEIHAYESLATLKFARRVSKVVTKAERGTIVGDNALIQVYLQEIADLKTKLAASMQASAKRIRSSDLSDDSDSEATEGEASLESEKEKLARLREERIKSEQEVQKLQLLRTKIQSQITNLSGLMLTSEAVPSSPSFGSSNFLPIHTRRRISELPRSGLGLGMPSVDLPTTPKRYISAIGVVEEDSFGGLGKERRARGLFSDSTADNSTSTPVKEEENIDKTTTLSPPTITPDELAEKESTITHLLLKVSDLESEIATASTNYASLEQTSAQSRLLCTDKIAKLELEVTELRSRLAATEESHEISSSTNAEKVQQLSKSYDALKLEHDQLGLRLVDQDRAYNLELDSTRLSLNQVRQQREASLLQTQDLLTSQVELKRQLAEYKTSSDDLRSSNATLESQVSQQTSQHASEVLALKALLDSKSAEEEIKHAQEMHSLRIMLEQQLDEERKSHSRQMREQEVKMEEAESAHASVLANEHRLLREMHEESDRQTKTQKEARGSEMESLSKKISELEESLSFQTKHQIELLSQFDKLTSDLKEARSETDNFKQSAELASRDLQLEKNDHTQTASIVADLEAQVAEKVQRINALNAQILTASTSNGRNTITHSPAIPSGLNLHYSGSLKESKRFSRDSARSSFTRGVEVDEMVNDLNKIISVQRDVIAELHSRLNKLTEIAELHVALPSSSCDTPSSRSPSVINKDNTRAHTLPRSNNYSRLESIVASPTPSTSSLNYPSSPSLTSSRHTKEPLGTLPGSPNFGFDGLSYDRPSPGSTYIPSRAKPPPLPYHGHQKSNSASARARRRITIDRDMEVLNSKSRVETSRGLFDSPSRPVLSSSASNQQRN
ncbi:Kinesin-like protein [Phaffia rhodozyma]|uniref:Kinesin-like protein n=1 Tax=Phaffia rhodozyma TaxID=264483 RepID=A0A0F7SQH9_PHARH|nr:Kinesin-like protein [Phaffia rhodozyma]